MKFHYLKHKLDMKALNDHCASECFETVLVRPCLLTNRSSLELQSLLSLQASKLGVQLI